MSRRSLGDSHLDPSTEVLLAEHERLANLYLYNTDLGEKRIASYITLISLAGGALIALTQLGSVAGDTFLELSAGIVGGLAILGLLTFYRLIERRIRSTEYLRAINRIHAYFVQLDPSLEPHFHWPPHDDVPPFCGSSSDMAGLRDVIAALNGIFLGILVGLLVYWFTHDYLVPVIVGLVVIVITWFVQQTYENRSLAGAEREARGNVKFPTSRVE